MIFYDHLKKNKKKYLNKIFTLTEIKFESLHYD